MLVTADDGARIYVEATADDGKPPLLFSNSLGTNLHMWDAQAAPFGESFRVVRYDSRGHGRSDAPDGFYTIERLGRDALAILDALGIERAYFCGLSKGGMVGQWLGANAPERIERLALCSTAAYVPAPDLWNHRILVASSRGMAPLADGILERWFTEAFRKDNPTEVARVEAMVLATPGIGYAACCAAIRDMDQREAIKRITLPTLVVAGEQDPATPPELGREIHRLIDGSQLVVLDAAAHLSNIEKPDAFNRAVLDFLLQ
jgi:3-oxoadipate enol-lactonase